MSCGHNVIRSLQNPGAASKKKKKKYKGKTVRVINIGQAIETLAQSEILKLSSNCCLVKQNR